MDLAEYIVVNAEIAATFAEDGALHTAADRLRDLAEFIQQKANEKDAALKVALAETKGVA